MLLSEFLKDSDYKLSQFKDATIAMFEATIFFRTVGENQVPYINPSCSCPL